MDITKWLIAYSDEPGRYYVVCLEHPRWYYIMDHVESDQGCEIQTRSFGSLASGIGPEECFNEDFAEAAYGAFVSVLEWFSPLPVCSDESDPLPAPRWIFGTAPELSRDGRKLLAFRTDHPQHLPALFAFDDDGYFCDIESTVDDFSLEAQEAFQLWTGANDNEPSRLRFMP
ncbi:MAG: hypothetical protein RH917_20625 [Lacipirellulaceae bacterium]